MLKYTCIKLSIFMTYLDLISYYFEKKIKQNTLSHSNMKFDAQTSLIDDQKSNYHQIYSNNNNSNMMQSQTLTGNNNSTNIYNQQLNDYASNNNNNNNQYYHQNSTSAYSSFYIEHNNNSPSTYMPINQMQHLNQHLHSPNHHHHIGSSITPPPSNTTTPNHHTSCHSNNHFMGGHYIFDSNKKVTSASSSNLTQLESVAAPLLPNCVSTKLETRSLDEFNNDNYMDNPNHIVTDLDDDDDDDDEDGDEDCGDSVEEEEDDEEDFLSSDEKKAASRALNAGLASSNVGNSYLGSLFNSPPSLNNSVASGEETDINSKVKRQQNKQQLNQNNSKKSPRNNKSATAKIEDHHKDSNSCSVDESNTSCSSTSTSHNSLNRKINKNNMIMEPHPYSNLHFQRSHAYQEAYNLAGILDDYDLVNLPLRELNKRLRYLPKQMAYNMKKRRRTLKNRKYAQNCRSKRLEQKSEMEIQNCRLKQELTQMSQMLDSLRNENHLLKTFLCKNKKQDLGLVSNADYISFVLNAAARDDFEPLSSSSNQKHSIKMFKNVNQTNSSDSIIHTTTNNNNNNNILNHSAQVSHLNSNQMIK